MNFNYSNSFVFYEVINNKGNVYINADNNTYFLGFENIFDFIDKDAKLLLDKIYNSSKEFNSGFIDNIVWLNYLTTSKIVLPPYQEQFVTNDNYDNIDIKIGRNGKSTTINLLKEKFNDNKLSKIRHRPLFPINKEDYLKLNLEIDENFYIVSKKIVYYNDTIELLLSFMNCLFSTRRKYYIKKCDLCEKYYVTNKSDTHYCKRNNFHNRNITCSEYVAFMQKTYDYKSKYEPLNRKIFEEIDMWKGTKYEKQIENYKNKYKKERDLKKLEYYKSGNIDVLLKFVNTYIENNPFPIKKS